MVQERLEIAAALAAAAKVINAPRDVDEMLDTIVRAARASVPGFDRVSVSLRNPDGKFETRAATDELVIHLDDVQYDLDEGPCVDAMKHHEIVVAEHLADDDRWPHYVPAAVEAGIRSQLGLQLYSEGKMVAGLNLYSTLSDTVHPESSGGAQLFATHAALALGHVRRETQLTEAVSTRTVIGQAMGLLMERYRMDQEHAFQFLVRASSTSNTKLRDIARRLVDDAETKYRSHPGAPELGDATS